MKGSRPMAATRAWPRRRRAIVALALVLLVLPAAVVASDRFSDVPDGHVFHDDIDAVAGAGVTLGCGGGKYCPGANVTRGQMAAFLNRAAALGAGRFPVAHAQSDVRTYCAIAAREPGSYDPAPCRQTLTLLDDVEGVLTSSALAIGADGMPVIAYRDIGTGAVRIARCGSINCATGISPATLAATATSVAVAVGADGLPIVAFADSGGLILARCATADCGGSITTALLDEASGAGTGASIEIGSDGLPIISYTLTSGELRVAHCGDAGCTTGNTITPIASSAGTQTSIAIRPDGLPIVAYQDTANADLNVVSCGDVACSSGNVTATVDSAGSVGSNVSMAIGADGLPVISYLDLLPADLKVAHCGNAACTEGNTATSLDTADMTGFVTSITIGLDGLPLVAYKEEGNDDLRLARCLDVECSDATITTLDETGSSGNRPSLAIGVDGVPIVAFTRDGNLHLVRLAAG